MKRTICAALLLVLPTAGCVTSGKYINTRGPLDESICYLEKDTTNSLYTISSNTCDHDTAVNQVPYPALVDMNSTIQILLAKGRIQQASVSSRLTKQLEELAAHKKAIAAALDMVGGVAQARKEVIERDKDKDPTQFFIARDQAATLETELLDNLMKLWPDTSPEYARLEAAYDRPTFTKLQQFLKEQIENDQAATRKIEDEIKTRKRTLSFEAFLYSPGKEPVAVHLDGYDSIKAETLGRIDRYGLDLSKEERQKLDDNVKATQELAASLERLKQKETSLNEELQKIRPLMAPDIQGYVNEAQQLYDRIQSAKLSERRAATKKVLDAYIALIKKRNEDLSAVKKNELESTGNEVLTNIKTEGEQFSKALETWLSTGRSLGKDWRNAPSDIVALVNETTDAINSLKELKNSLPQIKTDVKKRSAEFVEKLTKDVKETEREALVNSAEAKALRNDLESYYVDFRAAYELVTKAAITLAHGTVQQLAEMPSTDVSFHVPVENIKDTFIDLEATPRSPDDVITIKATLSEDTKEIDKSSAKFRVARFGHYAELSPAVVLVKPEQLQGGDDGFRFAPVLSWMHHWFPRPDDPDKAASFFRALDPAIGIHSAFTNFATDTSHDTVQIGLGITLSFWMNRLQFGVGENLMANSRNQGRFYYFVGSDMIGLLQTIGIAK